MANGKISDRADKAKKIRGAVQKADGNTAKRLERMLERAEKQIKSLGKTKLSILHGSLRRFNGHYSRLTNVEDIASNDKDKERLIQFNDILLDMENTIKKVSVLLENGIPSLNAGTLESIGVFGVTETLGTEAKDKDDVRFEGKGLTSMAFGPQFVVGGISGVIGNPFRVLLNWFKPKPVQKKIPERNEDVENFRSLMTSTGSRAEQMTFLLKDLEDLFKPALKEMIAVTKKHGYDCSNYTDNEEQIIFTAYRFAEAINRLLNTNLQTDEGKLNDKEFEEAFRNGQDLLSTFD